MPIHEYKFQTFTKRIESRYGVGLWIHFTQICCFVLHVYEHRTFRRNAGSPLII